MKITSEPKCPECGSNNVLLRQTEIAYYPITEVQLGSYDIGPSIDNLWDCAEEHFVCGKCEEYLDQKAIELASEVREYEW